METKPRFQEMEVVLVIPGEELATDSSRNNSSSNRDPRVEALEEPNPKPKSPEITKSSPSPRNPLRSPESESLLCHRSIPISAFLKRKSRFVEQPPPIVSNPADPQAHHGSPNHRASATHKTPSFTAEDDEEEEPEIYKREQFLVSQNPRRRYCKFRMLIEWSILLLSMGFMVTSLTLHRLQGYVIWGLVIWKWCLMVAVFCSGRLVSQWFIIVLVFLTERNFLLKKKVLYFVYGLKNSLQVCIWVGLVLLAWSFLFNHGVNRPPGTAKLLNYVTHALVSLLTGSIVWLAKTLAVKILASSFHMNRFFDRIQESIFHQYILHTLSNPREMELAEKMGCAKCTGQLSFRSMGKSKEKWKGGEELGVIDVAKLHRMRKETVSAWTMKGLINVIRSSGLTTISHTIDQSFEEEVTEQRGGEITSEWEAKAAAYRIFKNVARPGCNYIEEEDLLRFLSKEEVDIVLPSFEGAAETGKIKKSALKNWVVKAYQDRKSLAHSLIDTKTAVNQLHKLATALVIVLIIIVTLLLMGFATTQVLVLLSSQLLLVGFMFANTCKTAFEAIVFVFVMHPFDVGDRCVVDGIQMIVEEMNILTTVFLRYDNEKIYYPNAVLATKPISNFYRSPDMGDSVLFSIDVKTSVECIGALKARIQTYIESKPVHWHPNHSIVVHDIVNVNSINMALYIMHTMNFQNMGEKTNRRTELVLELKKIFEELSIQYNLLHQEVHVSYTGPTPLLVATGRSV